VGRLNGTIRGWWNRYFRGRMNPSEAIPLIQEKYNATKHRTTGQDPQHITTKNEYAKVRLEDELRGTEARNNITNNFHVGRHVVGGWGVLPLYSNSNATLMFWVL